MVSGRQKKTIINNFFVVYSTKVCRDHGKYYLYIRKYLNVIYMISEQKNVHWTLQKRLKSSSLARKKQKPNTEPFVSL